MRSASRQALATLREHVASGPDAGIDAQLSLADDLYSVANLLVNQPALRRTLGDPASSADGRAGLVSNLLASHIGVRAVEVAQDAVRQRWSSPWDLADSLELVANDTLFAAAEAAAVLDEVEDEIFRFERILEGENRLVTLLDELSVDAQRRAGLLTGLLAGKVHPITQALLEHAVTSQRKRSVIFAIDDLVDAAAARRHRSVARVTSAVELTEAQQARIASALLEIYGREMSVRTAVDPSIRGGLVIRVGDEVIDGSISSYLAAARAALAS